MISLEDYIAKLETDEMMDFLFNGEQDINEGITDLAKKFWNWLTGKTSKKKKKNDDFGSTEYDDKDVSKEKSSFNGKEVIGNYKSDFTGEDGKPIKIEDIKISQFVGDGNFENIIQVINKNQREATDDKYKFTNFYKILSNNHNHIPNIDDAYIRIGQISYQVDAEKILPIALIAYANSNNLKQYREKISDIEHDDYAHIFFYEVLPFFKDKKLNEKLIEGVLKVAKKGNKGITIKSHNKDLTKFYQEKFKFEIYMGQTGKEDPYMERKL